MHIAGYERSTLALPDCAVLGVVSLHHARTINQACSRPAWAAQILGKHRRSEAHDGRNEQGPGRSRSTMQPMRPAAAAGRLYASALGREGRAATGMPGLRDACDDVGARDWGVDLLRRRDTWESKGIRMGENIACPDCGSPMEEGYMPDRWDTLAVLPCWHPGKAAIGVFGGIKGFFWKSPKGKPVTAYRCPTCSYVKLYAR